MVAIDELPTLTAKSLLSAPWVIRDGRRQQCSIVCTNRETGKSIMQTFDFAWHPSHLDRGGHYCIVCPDTGVHCRKVYLYAGRYRSRAALLAMGLHYRKQLQGRIDRLRPERDPHRQRGKEHYRGRPTPYALACQRYDSKYLYYMIKLLKIDTSLLWQQQLQQI